MALTMPFRREQRFPALRQVRDTAGEQLYQAAEAVGQLLPRRRANWWERPLGRTVIAVVAGSTLLASLAMVLRQRAAAGRLGQEATASHGSPTTQAAAYDAPQSESDAGVDAVQEAEAESFPASDAPAWGNGPDLPIIREGEHKEALRYEQR